MQKDAEENWFKKGVKENMPSISNMGKIRPITTNNWGARPPEKWTYWAKKVDFKPTLTPNINQNFDPSCEPCKDGILVRLRVIDPLFCLWSGRTNFNLSLLLCIQLDAQVFAYWVK